MSKTQIRRPSYGSPHLQVSPRSARILLYLSIVPEVGIAGLDGILLGVRDLAGTKPEFLLMQAASFFAGSRRRSARPPVIFHGHEQQSRAAQDRKQQDQKYYSESTRHNRTKVQTIPPPRVWQCRPLAARRIPAVFILSPPAVIISFPPSAQKSGLASDGKAFFV